jgi:tetratricopeptide (TPR) repeat protein
MQKRTLPSTSLSLSIIWVALGLLQVCPASATIAYTPLEEGIRQFQARRYSLALGPLERAVSKAPHNAMCRYYLAGCYVHLSRHEDAMKEYDMAYRLDPFGPVSGYCRRALIGYGRSIPDEPELAALGKPAVHSPKRHKDVIQHNAPEHLDKAITTIRRQADFEKGRHKSASETFAGNAIKTGEGGARKILDDADAECKAIMEAPLVVAGGYRNDPYTVEHAKRLEMERRQALVAEIRKKAESDAARIRGDAQDRAQKFKQYSQDRQSALDEVADSLESQLSTSRLKDRVKMRAEGTGLYIRNFGVVPSPSPEVHNSVARIRPRELPQPPDGQPYEPGAELPAEPSKGPQAQSAGDAGVLPAEKAPPEPPQRSVRGKVLDNKVLEK